MCAFPFLKRKFKKMHISTHSQHPELISFAIWSYSSSIFFFSKRHRTFKVKSVLTQCDSQPLFHDRHIFFQFIFYTFAVTLALLKMFNVGFGEHVYASVHIYMALILTVIWRR